MWCWKWCNLLKMQKRISSHLDRWKRKHFASLSCKYQGHLREPLAGVFINLLVWSLPVCIISSPRWIVNSRGIHRVHPVHTWHDEYNQLSRWYWNLSPVNGDNESCPHNSSLDTLYTFTEWVRRTRVDLIINLLMMCTRCYFALFHRTRHRMHAIIHLQLAEVRRLPGDMQFIFLLFSLSHTYADKSCVIHTHHLSECGIHVFQWQVVHQAGMRLLLEEEI